MSDLLDKVFEIVKNQDPAKLMVTLDMLISGAALVEKLMITMNSSLTSEELQTQIDEIEVSYDEQKKRMKENIAKAKDTS